MIAENLFLQEWISFILRWAHLIAGISWIGSSFYFMWLDSQLEAPKPSSPKDVEGELWMTHSGGFYQVLRKKIGPGTMPETIHWFKYEALLTWLTGIFLLGVVYYMNHGAFLIESNSTLTSHAAVGVSLAIVFASWFIYDILWNTVGKSHPNITTILCIGLLVPLAYELCHLFSGRGAFIQLGAIFGTIMVANVWMRILPSQQKMIDATKKGEAPDFSLSGYAKRRSVHNSYLTFPVIFTMLSNHYSMAFSPALNWVILLLLIFFGMSLRHVMLAKGRGRLWSGLLSILCSIALIIVAAKVNGHEMTFMGTNHQLVPFSRVRDIVHSRCIACHSLNPTDGTFGPAPAGVIFDIDDNIVQLSERILQRVVFLKTMPFGNKTGMTDEERETIAAWIHQGANKNAQ